MAASGETKQRDHWSAKAYNNAASFVPALTTAVLKYLNAQPDEDILDIGCGDGVLTEKIAAISRSVVGLDSSRSFIQTANDTVKSRHQNTQFAEHDCRRIQPSTGNDLFRNGRYDKVFSNAAMHWILKDQSTRGKFFSDVFALLKPAGSFAFEMGGAGDVADVHTALISVLHAHYKVPIDEINAKDPWFFASENWMTQTLEGAGFRVEKIELEYRPTKVTERAADGSGGLEGWTRLMGAQFLELLPEQQRPVAIKQICDVLHSVVTREEDGSQYIGYVRLRALAKKP